jgi:hypothetical protein
VLWKYLKPYPHGAYIAMGAITETDNKRPLVFGRHNSKKFISTYSFNSQNILPGFPVYRSDK